MGVSGVCREEASMPQNRNASGIGMSQLENPFLPTPRVHPLLDVDRVVCQNLRDFLRFDLMRGDVSPVVFVPVIPDARRHVHTLYRHSREEFYLLHAQ